MSYPELELYYFEACPYCRIVLNAIDRLNLEVTYRHIHEDRKNYERLIRDTGRGTTPCLYIDSKPMHESSDIIEWLEKNQGHLKKRG